MKTFGCAVAALAMSALAVTGCSDSPPAPDVQFLASDVHLVVGGHHIVIPAVAMRGPDHTFDLRGQRPGKSLKERLKSEATDPANPMRMDKLDLGIREYQYTGEHVAASGICPLLTRKWAQSLCRGQHRGVLRRLPERFDLLDRARLDLLKNTWTSGKERLHDLVKDMAIQPGITEVGCDRESRFCTAMVEVLPGLLAVWFVQGERRTAEEIAHTQGAAIIQFVRRALSATEDVTLTSVE
jgi:hypothetical protein